MKTITLLNEKGGVGKTSMSVHIAAGLAIRGKRVVLFDADAQANATMMLGFDPASSMSDLLVHDANFNDVLVRVPPQVYQPEGQQVAGDLLLVRSDVSIRNIASQLGNSVAVRDRVKDLEGWADVIIFDTAPTPSLFHSLIYLATDIVLCPTICDQLSMAGLENSVIRIQQVQQAKTIQLGGIIPTMHRSKTALHHYNLTVLKDRYGGLVWPPVAQRIVWAEASQMRQSIFAYEPGGSAAAEMWRIVGLVETIL